MNSKLIGKAELDQNYKKIEILREKNKINFKIDFFVTENVLLKKFILGGRYRREVAHLNSKERNYGAGVKLLR